MHKLLFSTLTSSCLLAIVLICLCACKLDFLTFLLHCDVCSIARTSYKLFDLIGILSTLPALLMYSSLLAFLWSDLKKVQLTF